MLFSGSYQDKEAVKKQSMLLKEIKKLNKRNDSFKRRLQKAKNLSTNSSFQNALGKFKTLAALFTVMQFREVNKPKMGRRFTQDEKIMSLSLYKLGPRAYRWLSKIFVLPSPVTISRMVSKAGLQPGINEKIFNNLKEKCLKMKREEKLCVLIFDEMALKPHFDFNRKKDKILGFVKYDGESINKMADHVLVFMIRGITKNFKQPLYYAFCSGSTPKLTLSNIIKNIVKKLYSSGFTVLATVCDQGTSNISAINHLINETKSKYMRRNEILRHNVFEVENHMIIPLYDVPHMLKGIRNNLLSKNLKYVLDGKERLAKWDHITKLYENNPTYKGLKIIKNLTENHCNKEKIPKMKVKFASQLFSQTVGKTMGYLAGKLYYLTG